MKCSVGAVTVPGTATLMARVWNAEKLRLTGSLTTSEPGAIVAVCDPPKVTGRNEPSTIAGPEALIPTLTGPSVTGALPNRLLRWIRSVCPPR